MVRWTWVSCLALAVLFVGSGDGRAERFEVNAFGDPDPGAPDGVCLNAESFCTLRDAVQEALFNGVDDTIELTKAGTYRLDLQDPTAVDDDTAATGDLDVGAGQVEIRGLGAGATVIDVGFLEPAEDRAFHVLSGATLVLTDVTVSGGVATSAGTDSGGAIWNQGTLILRDCWIDGNEADVGGGVANEGGLLVERSTFSRNRAMSAGAALHGSDLSLLILENVTVSGNLGPGAVEVGDGQTRLAHVTIFDNDGVGLTVGGGLLLLENSIVAASGTADCSAPIPATHSLSSDASCGFVGGGNLGSTDPMLDPVLQENGGSTPNHLPLDGSEAIDAASSVACLDEDQRGQCRPDLACLGPGLCDMGAIEVSEPAAWLVRGAALLLAGGLAGRRRT